MKLGQLAGRLGCQLYGGDVETEIRGVSTLDRAQAGEITFLSNLRYASKVKDTAATAIIAAEPLALSKAATLVSANPYHDFARALGLFYEAPRPAAGVHPTAVIAETAQVGANASIGAYAVIGEHVELGANAVLHPHSVIYESCEIGDDFVAHSHVSVREFSLIGHRVTLHNGVVIGGDGFGFAKTAEGRQFKIPQTGRVVIEDDVEVQTLTSIDRATMGETRVKRGAKIDSLCQIGHACMIGEDNIICGQTGLAGSTVLGENVIMAGQTGSAGHLKIGKNAIVWAQTGLRTDVAEGAVVAGTPAYDSRDWLRATSLLPKLPDLQKTIRALERRLAALESSREKNRE